MITAPPYHVQSTADALRDGFPYFAHHDSVSALWSHSAEDSIFPVEDSIIAAARGSGKDLVIRGDRRHMGNPGAEEILYEWLDKVIDGRH